MKFHLPRTRRRRWLSVVALVAVLATAGIGLNAWLHPQPDVSLTRLSELPVKYDAASVSGMRGLPYVAAAHGRRYAFVSPAADGERVVLDGVAGPPFDRIRWLGFSPSGKHLAYVATTKDRAQALMVIDGQPGWPFAFYDLNDLRATTWAGDELCLCTPQVQGQQRLVRNGRPGPLGAPYYRAVFPLTVSPDGAHVATLRACVVKHEALAYAERIPQPPEAPDEQDGCVEVDDQAVAYFQTVIPAYGGSKLSPPTVAPPPVGRDVPTYAVVKEPLLFDPRDQQVVFVAQLASGKWTVVHGRTPGPEYDEIGSVVAATVPPQLVYAARQGQQWTVVTNDQPSPWWDEVGGPTSVTIVGHANIGGAVTQTADVGQPPLRCTMAYYCGVRQGQLVHGVAGESWPAGPVPAGGGVPLHYDEVAMSQDGHHLSVVTTDADGQRAVVHDGKAEAGCKFIGLLTQSPDGEHVAYWGVDHKGVGAVIRGGTRLDPCALPQRMIFSPDSQHLTWATIANGQLQQHCDGRRWDLAGNGVAGVGFSRDSSRAWALVANARGLRLWVDGVPGPWVDSQAYYDGRTIVYLPPRGPRLACLRIIHHGNQVVPQWLEDLPLVGRIFHIRQYDSPQWVLDGKAGKEYLGIQNPGWSTDGRHFVYGGICGPEGKYGYMVLDGEEGPPLKAWLALSAPRNYWRNNDRPYAFAPDGTLSYFAIGQDGLLYRVTHRPRVP